MYIKERLTANNYEIKETKKSRIDKLVSITTIVGYSCPMCNSMLHVIKHGTTTYCKCGLKIRLTGNVLTCSIDI
jgi:hypothetical protein